MSSTGQQLGRSPGPSAETARSPLAHLLHALNQPLTGLQCSMELALAGLRPKDHYIRTLSEGLELVSRMRVLVEALRELADLPEAQSGGTVVVLLDNLLREVSHELSPVADSSNICLAVTNAGPLPVRAQVGPLTGLVFRTIESALSLCCEGSELCIEGSSTQNMARVNLSWKGGPLPQHSPFSGPELGLLLARAGWEQMGGSFLQNRRDEIQECTIRVPLAWSTSHPETERTRPDQGDRK